MAKSKIRRGNHNSEHFVMKHPILIIILTLGLMIVLTADSYASWDISFESKTVSPNAADVNLDVSGSWDIPLTNITCPIIVRKIDGGSFWTGALPYDTGGNGYYHPRQHNVQWKWETPFATLIEEFRPGIPTGNCPTDNDGGYNGNAPDHFVITAAGSIGSEDIHEDFNFLSFQFDVTAAEGSFEFDTACFSATLSSISMIGDDFPPVEHGPMGTGEASFVKGVITISEELERGWWPQCACPNPDGTTEDVITDPFGARYVTGNNPPYGYHEGVDIDFEVNEPIHAVANGTVAERFDLGVFYWQQNINSTVLDQDGNVRDVQFVYVHVNEPNIDRGDPVEKGDAILTCGNYKSHLHLMAKPDYDYSKRAHPVRFLSKPENICPVINVGLGDPLVDNDYLQCTSLSQKSEKYDLAVIHIFVYTSDESRHAIIDFENHGQMEAHNNDPEFRFFAGTEFDVTVTLTPLQPMLTGDSLFSRINIKVDPVAWVPDCDYVGVYLEDVDTLTKCSSTGLCNVDPFGGRITSDLYCPGIGNFSGESPGMLLEYFNGQRLNDCVELGWRGISGVGATGVIIYRASADGVEEPIHNGILPFAAARSDTVHYYDYATRSEEELRYRLQVVFPNGARVFAEQKVVIQAEMSENDAIPYAFLLEQNYPNPFNAGTIISYVIDADNAGTVTIDIYDILGRQVKTLYSNEITEPGRYTINWDGSDGNGQLMASGVYYCRLKAAKGYSVKKMILMR
jgi:hypothetical protein